MASSTPLLQWWSWLLNQKLNSVLCGVKGYLQAHLRCLPVSWLTLPTYSHILFLRQQFATVSSSTSKSVNTFCLYGFIFWSRLKSTVLTLTLTTFWIRTMHLLLGTSLLATVWEVPIANIHLNYLPRSTYTMITYNTIQLISGALHN